jgi:hypothetical protein
VTRNRKALATLALAFLAASGAAAMDAPVAIRPTWGVLVENVFDTATPAFAPSINFNLGTGFILPFSADSSFSFVPSADIYYYYAALNTSSRAVPTEYSQRGSAFVLGLLLDAPVVYNLPLGPKFSLGGGLGLCLDARVAFATANDAMSAVDTPSINRYLWDKARFLMPSTVLRGEYTLTDNVAFGFKGRMLWPIANLWANEGFGFFDHSIYLIDVALTVRLGQRNPSPSEPASSDATPAPEVP